MIWTAVLVSLLSANSYILVFQDGGALTLEAAPESHEGLLIATLPDGTVVSVPESRVDWAASEQANRLPPEIVPLPAEPRTLAARPAGLLIDNDTIARFRDASPGPPAAPQTGLPAAVVESAVVESVVVEGALDDDTAARRRRMPVARSVPLDDQGRGEEYWRERARAVRSQLRVAERERAAAERMLAEERDRLVRGRRVVASNGGVTVVRHGLTEEELGAIVFRISQLEESVAYAEARLLEARSQQHDLANEARRARALPGWLRE